MPMGVRFSTGVAASGDAAPRAEPPDAAPVESGSAAPGETPIDLREPAGSVSVTVSMRGPLDGRVAVVTGGGDPVGRAVAMALLAAGARVCVVGRDTDSLKLTTAAAGPNALILYLQCDLGSVAEVEGAADFIARFDRPVDVLVHAAQVHVPHTLAAGPVADLDEQYLVNVRGPYLLTQKLLPQIIAGPGHVVFLAGGSAGEGRIGDIQHDITRAAVAGIASGLRAELEPTGVRVTSVHSGGSRTMGGMAALGVDPLEIAATVVSAVSLPVMVEAADVRVRPTIDLTF